MALINCPECGKEISDKASICINCGFPIAEEKNNFDGNMNCDEATNCNKASIYEKEIYEIILSENVPMRDIAILQELNQKGLPISREELSETLASMIKEKKIKTVFDGTLKYEIQEQVEKVSLDAIDKYKTNHENLNKVVKCPKCGSTQIQLLNRKWTPLMGIMTNKVDRVCMNCKKKF